MIINSAGRLLVFCGSIWILVQLRNVLDRERRFARQDSLTQLSNRRDFFLRGRQLLAQAQRDGAPITAVFIDLDKFKRVNDEAGHKAGDAVLFCVAEVLSARLRSNDVAGRLGGDEFALLLPGMEGTATASYVGDLQHRLLTAMASREWPVTFSIGVASCQRAPVDFDALMAEADAVMYEVKHGGRNRVLQKELKGTLINVPGLVASRRRNQLQSASQHRETTEPLHGLLSVTTIQASIFTNNKSYIVFFFLRSSITKLLTVAV